ncbi:hypothetical protein [Porphyromonas macacae]|nr:hypothetical protein [Porphyromonas macacae]
MVENSSGKEKKSKLTSLKIHQAKNFQPSGNGFSSLWERKGNGVFQENND